MIQKLKIKFVCINMTMLTLVLVLILGGLNLSMLKSNERQSLSILRSIAENEGKMPKRNGPKENEKPPQEKNISANKKDKLPNIHNNFSVKLSDTGEILQWITEDNTSLEQAEMEQYLSLAMDTGMSEGIVGEMRFLREPREDGSLYVFLDNTIEQSTTKRLLWLSLGAGGLSLLVFLGLSLFLAEWAVRPVKKAFLAQKQFVADASHELKTPLAVISANVDVLESEIGENKWLGFIVQETKRMNTLVNELLYLAKADQTENLYEKNLFSLSEAVWRGVLPFESLAFEGNQTLEMKITDDIDFVGDESRIQQVVAILMDNALKHTPEKGDIQVSLSLETGKAVLRVRNTGQGIPKEEQQRIFERFYRSDSSRDRETGGYGLGLSIAKSIVEGHKGKIYTVGEEGKWIEFVVVL